MPSSFVKDKIGIEIDVTDNASPKIKTLKGNVQSLDKDLSSVTGSAAKLDAGLKAFSWTTFAGGALNVSTAVAQVYTSLSNLDKVQLLVKNSMVGVERAEDLLAKKTSILNKEIEKNGSLSEKSIRLRNEIATATEDLTNKEEKLRLAQGQVNDTYLLFTSNVVNTVFGTVQTLAGMYAMLSQRKIFDSAMTVINTGATKINNTIKGESVLLSQIQWLEGAKVTAVNIANTASTWSLTVAMRALGTAVRANPLFLPATLATLAIGVGVTAYEMDQMGKRAKEAEEKLSITASTVGMTSTEFSELSSIMGTGSAAMADYSSATVDVTTKIDKLTESIDKLQKMQDSINKQKGRRGEQNVKSVEDDIEKLEAAKKVLTDKQLAEIKVLNDAFKSFAAGDIAKLEPAIIKTINQQLTAVSQMADLYDSVTDSHDDYIASLNIGLDRLTAEGTILEENRNILYQTTLERKNLNNVSASGNKANENSLKTQSKLYDDLKKKLDEEWGYTKPGRNLRSFISGETNYFPGEKGAGFSGYINQKTNEYINDRVTMDAFNRVKAWEYHGKIMLQQKDANGNPLYTVAQVIKTIEPNINRIKNESNVSFAGIGGEFLANMKGIKNKFSRDDQSWQQTMAQLQLANLPKQFESELQKVYFDMTGQITTMAGASARMAAIIGVPASEVMESMRSKSNAFNIETAQNYYNKQVYGTNAKIAAMPKAGTPKAGTIKTSASKSSNSSSWSGSYGGKSYSSSGLTRSKGGGGRNANTSQQMEFQRLQSLGDAENQYYLGLTGVGTGLATERYSIAAGQHGTRWLWDDFYKRINEANTRIRLGKQILALGAFDPDASGNIFTNTSSQLTSMLQREQQQITHQAALLGETTQNIITLRNSPEPELLDRMRYSERLEQISTGATVF